MRVNRDERCGDKYGGERRSSVKNGRRRRRAVGRRGRERVEERVRRGRRM